jgi:hypothetical protein
MKALKKMIFILEEILADVKKHSIFAALYNAKVAQLVERQPSKLNVASSNLVFRSKSLIRNNKAFLMLHFNEIISDLALLRLLKTSFNYFRSNSQYIIFTTKTLVYLQIVIVKQ